MTECYRPLWKADLVNHEELHFLDKDGQYAYIAMISEFPVGQYTVITCDLEQTVIENSAMYLNGKELYGLVLARVLCPQDSFYPFLMLRNETSGKVSQPICRLCSELEQVTSCNHSIR